MQAAGGDAADLERWMTAAGLTAPEADVDGAVATRRPGDGTFISIKDRSTSRYHGP